MPELARAATTVIRQCLAVQEGEDVLVVVDGGTQAIGEALRDAAAQAGAEAVLVFMDERENHGAEPPRPITAALSACDVFIAPTSRSLSDTQARKQASDAGVRGATLSGVTAAMLGRVMAVEFELMSARSRAVADLLSTASSARLTCPRGSDFTFELTGRGGLADDGDLTAAGAFGTLPAGEGFIAPLSGSGTIVASSLAELGRSDQPATLTVREGRIEEAQGGLGPPFLELLQAHGELGCNLAELGIGTNECATLTGNVREDEKILGSVHVAFGASAGIGGNVSVPIHLGAVVVDASLEIGGRPVLDDGRYVLAP